MPAYDHVIATSSCSSAAWAFHSVFSNQKCHREWIRNQPPIVACSAFAECDSPRTKSDEVESKPLPLELNRRIPSRTGA